MGKGRRLYSFAALAAVVSLFGGPAATLAQPVTSTHSFSNQARGAHPSTLTYASGKITVDLSALPGGAQIYRAILVPHRPGTGGQYPASDRSYQALTVEAADAPGAWLPTLAPRHLNLECTAAAQRALLKPDRKLVLNVISFAQLGWSSAEIRLDVWCDQPAVHAIGQATNLQAVHADGDTLLTYTEVEQPLTTSPVTGAQYTAALNTINATDEIRYRIYRSAAPVDATTIRAAELVDEIGPLSGCNTTYSQADWNTRSIPTLPVADMTFASPTTGIYARRAGSAGSAHYAVSRVVSGEEDLSSWTPGGNRTAQPVAEAAGPGMALQWKLTTTSSFQYVNNPTLYFFVKWECPPTYNVPSTAHNYLVAVPPTTVNPRPVDVALHCWGGSLESCYGWWYEAESGALLVATNQVPYDWWTAFHENSGTIRPFTNVEGNGGGVVRNYTQQRILSFLFNTVAERWNVDANHIAVSGSSMGGSGATMWGVRRGDLFAHIISWVGVHIPALTPGFVESFEGSYGKRTWNCLYADSGMTAFDYWDTERWLREHVAADTPFVSFANGKNDSSIGWNQAYLFARALQETRRPHLFKWGQSGHGERAALPGTLSDRYMGIDTDLNKTLPAFTYCSLDQNPGNGDPAVGDPSGYRNAYLLWQPNDSRETARTWAMTCYLISSAPQATCTVDITPRRCQVFAAAPGAVCKWTNTSIATGLVIESGCVTADAYGLVTLPQVTVSKTKNRIAIRVKIPGDVDNDGDVDLLDINSTINAFGTIPGHPAWNPEADFDCSGIVDVFDVIDAVINFGTGT